MLPAAVTITPVGTGQANVPTGFIFSAPTWLTTNGVSLLADVNITFDVKLDLNPAIYKIASGAMTLNSTITNPGVMTYVSGGETFTDNDTSGTIGTLILNDSDPGTTDVSDTLLLGTSNVNINKDILLFAGDAGSTVQLNSILETFTYTAVPEPGSFLLAGAGIGLLFLIRRRKQLLNLFGILVVLGVMAAGAHASPITCASISGQYLQSFITAGSCTIGEVTFGFSPTSLTASGTGVLPTAAQTTVNVSGIGFQFVPLAITNAGQSETFTITYTATAASEKIKGFTATSTVTGRGTYSFAGSQAQLKNGATTVSSVGLPTGGVGSPFTPIAAGTTVTIVDTFNLSATSTPPTNFAHVSNLKNTITLTPEPLTSVLCGAGLLVIGFTVRSRRAKQ